MPTGTTGDDFFELSVLEPVYEVDGGDGVDTLDLYGPPLGEVIMVRLDREGQDQFPTAYSNRWTISGIENLSGYEGDESLYGNSSANILAGEEGNDTLWDSAGGNDLLLGDGALRLVEGQLSITLDGGSGGGDLLIAAGGDDELHGGGGNDYMQGGAGIDLLYGGTGADLLLGGTGNDEIHGGDGIDRASYVQNIGDSISSGVTVSLLLQDQWQDTGHGLDLLTSIEHLSGSALADQLTGDGNANYLWGGNSRIVNGAFEAGNDDVIHGGGGDDMIGSGFGNHQLDGGSGTDALVYVLNVSGPGAPVTNLTISLALQGTAQDTGQGLWTVTGFENLSGALGDDVLSGDDGANVIGGDAGADTLTGGGGDDALYGDGEFGLETGSGYSGEIILIAQSPSGYGDDILDGGAGADLMVGGGGSDTYYLDDLGDEVVEQVGDVGEDLVVTGVARYTLPQGVEAVWGTSDIGQTLVGNGGQNWIRAGNGNDVLIGGGNSDILFGEYGDDTYIVSDLHDAIIEVPDESGGTDQVRTALASFSLEGYFYVENLVGTGSLGQNFAGNELANRIDGGAGADTMAGAAGDDVYLVDEAGDTIVELRGGGTDSVETAIAAYALADHVENITGTGSADQVLTGNALANRIDGGAGADRMAGGAGNDIYIVGETGDRAVERAGDGYDRVLSTISYTLAGQEVERLELTGEAAIDAAGNALDNAMFGNDAANRLSGGGGADTLRGYGGDDRIDGGTGADLMVGGTGNDLFHVEDAGDRVIEGAGGGTDAVRSSIDHVLGAHVENLGLAGTADLSGTGNGLGNAISGNGGANELRGEAGNDVLSGAAGNDALYGGLGADQLRGGAGADAFHLDSAPGAANADRILDFSVADDTIMLDASVFTAFGMNGTIGAGQFHAGTAAQDWDDVLLYDAATGNIFYDQDGSGHGAALLIATVNRGTALTHADFVVYNAPPAGELAGAGWPGI